jgi:hypothetical protein
VISRSIVVGVVVFALVCACGSSATTVAGDNGDPASDATRSGERGEADQDELGDGSGVVAHQPEAIELDQLGLQCGHATFAGLELDVDVLVPFTDDLDAYITPEAAVEFDTGSAWISSLTLYEVERSDARLVLFGVRPGSPSGAEPYFTASFKRQDGDWSPAGWGDCWLQVDAPGFGIGQLALDPADEPTAAATSLALLVTERACASGQVPEGREVQPIVTESDETLKIVVLIEAPVGDQSCQGNPSFPLEVDLDQPLGDRTIIDVALSPPTELVWPIPLRPSRLSVAVIGTTPAPGSANVFTWSDPSAGGLLVKEDFWGTSGGPGVIQSFDGDLPRTITGFVGSCGGDNCIDECEGAGCDQIERLSAECEADYEVTDTHDTTITITYTASGCSIQVETNRIE